MVQPKTILQCVIIFALLTGFCAPAQSVLAAQPPARSAEVTAYDLILAMNTLRVSYGLAPLQEDGIIDAVAQGTAEIMAANQMSWHIGDVSGRLASAGFGGGSKVWATENFAVGKDFSIDEIMVVWSDASHMIPAVNPAYCKVGAGVATASNGMTYFVLQAAYTAGTSCGEYTNVNQPTAEPGKAGTQVAFNPGVPQIIVPVKIATPDKEGKIYHVVEAGQSFWAIAVAYKTTIKDIETWNNLSRNSKLQIGQKLFIPSADTVGYSTPTPVGMIQLSTPDQGGKIVHTVEAYQTFSTIAQAYKIDVDTLLALNSWQADWPLQIGQKLLIDFLAPHIRFGETEVRGKESEPVECPPALPYPERRRWVRFSERNHITDHRLLKTGILLAIGVTIHNIPEGIAVGAGYMHNPDFGLFIACAILLHNIPEGIATALPLCRSGMCRWDSFRAAFLSGLAEPIGAVIAALFLGSFGNFVPGALAFAGGHSVGSDSLPRTSVSPKRMWGARKSIKNMNIAPAPKPMVATQNPANCQALLTSSRKDSEIITPAVTPINRPKRRLPGTRMTAIKPPSAVPKPANRLSRKAFRKAYGVIMMKHPW
ncbi:MAG TPA: LysM peptidoglycan-binding domain-containing protein [Anaerolineaceae bacterium]|nr:LysM peptidoglycan-binding domain-containing protein [Anaerolineaceae bacterium]